MRQDTATYLFPGAFAPILSLDALISQHNADSTSSFEIPDHDSLQPDEQIAQAEGFAALDQFVNSLHDRDRQLVKRLFWQGHTQTQIAADLGVSKMAVSKALARICKHGRAFLAPHHHLAFIN